MTLFHVAIGYDDKSLPVKTIQDAFGESAGWARYAPNCWMVSSQESSEVLAKRLRKVCSTKDGILVVEINKQNRHGYLKKELWDWLKKR